MNLMDNVLRASRGIIYYFFYRLFFWPKLFASAMRGKGEIVPIAIGNLRYKLEVHPSEGGFAEDIFLMRVREHPNVHFVKQYLEKHQSQIDTYVGIGSNVGYYAVLAHKLLSRLSSRRRNFFFIEPVPVTFKRLLRNLALNDISRKLAHNVAIGDRNGTVQMVVPEAKNLSHVRSIHATYPGDTIKEVSLMRLSTFAAKHGIGKRNILFRWDIEGYEYNVVKGNADYFASLTRARIIMELHPFYLGPEKSMELFDLLSACGFKLDQVVSCEPLYFLHMPGFMRKFLIRNFLLQHRGESLGLLPRYRHMKTLIADLQDTDNPVYSYPNLHIFLSKK